MNARKKGIYLITLCCITYGAAYMCRINLSCVVDKLAAGMGRDVSAISLFGSIQAIVYAMGQFLNGKLINRWKPGRILLFAALGSGVCNLAMGLVNGYAVSLILWAVNAYIQSFLWGAIVRVITAYPVSHNNTSIMALGISMSVAYVITWSLIAALLSGTQDWHGHFLIPGVVLLITVPLWLTVKRTCPETELLQQNVVQRSYGQIFRYIWREKVTIYCAVSVLMGALREGILFWTPLILTQLLTGDTVSPYLVVAIIPMVKMFGPVLLRLAIKRWKQYTGIMAVSFAVMTALALILALVTAHSTLFTVVLLTVLTLVCCLIGPIITSYIPLSYADDDMSAPVSGILDAMVYLGGSVSTYLLGHLVGNGVLTGAGWYWMVVALLGTVASTAALRLVKPRHENVSEA